MTASSTGRRLLSVGLTAVALSACSTAPSQSPTPSSEPPPTKQVSDARKCDQPRCVGLVKVKGLVVTSVPRLYAMQEAGPNDAAPDNMPEVRPGQPQPVPMPGLLSEQELRIEVPPALR